MSAADVEQLTNALMRLAAEERFEELEKYEFISISYPHAGLSTLLAISHLCLAKN